MQRWPGSDEAKKARLDIRAADVFALVRGERHDEVLAAIDELIADFAGDAYLPYIVWITGEEYYYEDALIFENQELIAKAQDYFQKATSVWERVITDFPDSNYAADAYFYSARCFSRIGEYSKAIDLYNVVAGIWPEREFAWDAQFLIGQHYQKLADMGELSRSAADVQTRDAYERLVEKYPDCPAAMYARTWIDHNVSADETNSPGYE